MMTTLDGFAVPVGLAGPEKGVVVVIMCDEDRPVAAYDAVCERLHTASLRTVVIGFDARLTAKSVVGILDALGISWAVVVGDRAGGDLAWELAATRLGRFVGLVASTADIRRLPMSKARSGTQTARRWRWAPPCWSARPPRGRWPATASATCTPSTARSICSPGAMRKSRPRSWPPRSCCAPAPGKCLVD